MLCPKCEIEMTIRAAVQVAGGDSPDKPTRVYLVQRFFCRNPACTACGREMASVRHEMEAEAVEE